MYDPIKLSEKIENLVLRGSSRKYYRFRSAKFYGGIASADCVGCNLRCVYCWSNNLAREGKTGKFYSPDEVVDKLVKIARKHGFNQVRITGNEPTIGKDHLIGILENIPKDITFILETNGILLGSNEKYVKELKKFDNLYVRVSLKGCTEKEFEKLTGAEGKAFNLQLNALRYCTANGIPSHPAILVDLVGKDNIKILKRQLAEVDRIGNLEFEELISYPHVVRRLKKANIWK